MRSKLCRGQPGQLGVKLLRNTLWLPDLVERTLDQCIMHCWIKGHAGVSQSQPRVKLLRNAPWQPKLVGRTPDWSALIGSKIMQGSSGSIRGKFPKMPKATNCGQCRFSHRAEKINNLARSTIVYFIIALIMPLGALALYNKCYNTSFSMLPLYLSLVL